MNTPSHLIASLLLSACALSACGESSQDAPAATAAPSTTPLDPNATVAEQIAALEKSGALPALDRSADIKGPDLDNNGVRDDIDAWIAALPITPAQKKAATQMAAAQQKTLLVDLNDKDALQAAGDETMAGISCLWDVFRPDMDAPHKLSGKVEAITANTKARAYRYIQYNQAASGSTTKMPEGNTCK